MTPSPMVKLVKEESIVGRETQHRSYLQIWIRAVLCLVKIINIV